MTQALSEVVRGKSMSPRETVRCDRRRGRDADAELGEALSLTGDIYDAALDPALWPETLRRICEFVGGVATALTSEDIASGTGRFYYSWGDEPSQTKLYFEKYCRINPVLVPMLLLEVGAVRSASDLISRERLRATRFYDEWLSLTGYGDNTFAIIDKSAAVLTILATTHEERCWPAGPKPQRRTELIVPHVRRAVAIGNVIQRHKVDAEALADAVDVLDAGVFLLGEDGALTRANAVGRELLAMGDMLGVDGGLLAARGAQATQHALRSAVAESASGRLAVNPRGLAIPLVARGGDRYVAHILPLNSGRRRKAALSSRTSMAVFVHKAAVGGLLPLEAIAQHFRLSPAEVRVLVAVMEAGGSVADVAAILGISGPTVKTHLRRLFEKTGARGQTDLVRLVAGYSTPLIAQPEEAAAISP